MPLKVEIMVDAARNNELFEPDINPLVINNSGHQIGIELT